MLQLPATILVQVSNRKVMSRMGGEAGLVGECVQEASPWSSASRLLPTLGTLSSVMPRHFTWPAVGWLTLDLMSAFEHRSITSLLHSTFDLSIPEVLGGQGLKPHVTPPSHWHHSTWRRENQISPSAMLLPWTRRKIHKPLTSPEYKSCLNNTNRPSVPDPASGAGSTSAMTDLGAVEAATPPAQRDYHSRAQCSRGESEE